MTDEAQTQVRLSDLDLNLRSYFELRHSLLPLHFRSSRLAKPFSNGKQVDFPVVLRRWQVCRMWLSGRLFALSACRSTRALYGNAVYKASPGEDVGRTRKHG
jgi:hypothetical protein